MDWRWQYVFSVDVYLRCFWLVIDLGNLLLLLSTYSSLRESKYPPNTRFDQYSYVQFPTILSRFFNFSHCDLTIVFCLPHQRFCFESLWNIVPKQPRSHVQKHMHHPHVQHLHARWCVMLLMSDVADMMCQVLAAGTWGSWLNAPYSHTATPCIHTE